MRQGLRRRLSRRSPSPRGTPSRRPGRGHRCWGWGGCRGLGRRPPPSTPCPCPGPSPSPCLCPCPPPPAWQVPRATRRWQAPGCGGGGGLGYWQGVPADAPHGCAPMRQSAGTPKKRQFPTKRNKLLLFLTSAPRGLKMPPPFMQIPESKPDGYQRPGPGPPAHRPGAGPSAPTSGSAGPATSAGTASAAASAAPTPAAVWGGGGVDRAAPHTDDVGAYGGRHRRHIVA